MPRRTYIAVPTDVVGIADRLTNAEAPFIKHPMIRQTWHTADKFRGMQGYYMAISNDPIIDPTTQAPIAGSTFQNYSAGGSNMLSPYEAAWATWWSWQLGDVGKARARPFKIRIGADLHEWTAQDSPSWDQWNSRNTGTFLLLYDQIAWNIVGFGGTFFYNYSTGEYDPPPLASLLDKDILESLDGTPYSQGHPYTYRYLNSGFNDSDPIVQTSVDGVFEGTLNTTFYDYTMQWEGRTETPSDGDLAAYDWEITSTYNYYLNTSPAYESITANINEVLLPNYYILERAREAAGVISPLKYNRQIMLLADLADGQDPTRVLNTTTIRGGFTLLEGVPLAEDNPSTPLVNEALDYKGIGYMQAYCGELQRLMTDEELDGVTTAFTSQQKNIAVVASDLPLLNRDVTRDNRGTLNTDDDIMALDMYPFYNRISIPHDPGSVRAIGGTADSQASVFQQMYDEGSPDRRALNMLQMYIAYMLSNGASPASTKDFKLYTEDSSMDKNVVNVNIDFLLDMGTVFAARPNHEDDLDFMEEAVGAYNTPGLPEPGDIGNLIFLKDYGHNTLLSQNNLANLRGAANVRLKHNAWQNTRSMYEILSNSPCFNETLMYIVEKRVVDPAGTLSTDPVQTFYISKDFKNQSTINYIDTQIKYGAEYQYTVKEVRLVVGSKYKYEELMIWHTQDDEFPNFGRAVGNAIGAFQDPGVNSPMATYFEESYLAPRHDTPKLQFFSGQYIYQPTNQSALNQSAVYAQAEWLTTSDYMYSDYDVALRGILSGFGDGIHLQFKTGDGAEGNAHGGMVAGDLTGIDFVPPNEAPTGNLTQAYATWLIERLYAGSGIGYELGTGDWAAAVHVLLHCPGCQRPPTFAEVKTDAGFQTAMTIGNTPSIRGAPVFALPGDDVMNIAWETYGALADYRILIGHPNWVPSPTKFLQFLKANPLIEAPGNGGK